MSENRLCYGCMEVKGEQVVCPHCGYQDGTPYLPDYIAQWGQTTCSPFTSMHP